jgi:hypothetical protein
VVHAGPSQLLEQWNQLSEEVKEKIQQIQICLNNNWLIVINHHMVVMVVLKTWLSHGLQRMVSKQELHIHMLERTKIVNSKQDNISQLVSKLFQLQTCKVPLQIIQSLLLLMLPIGVDINQVQ